MAYLPDHHLETGKHTIKSNSFKVIKYVLYVLYIMYKLSLQAPIKGILMVKITTDNENGHF